MSAVSAKYGYRMAVPRIAATELVRLVVIGGPECKIYEVI